MTDNFQPDTVPTSLEQGSILGSSASFYGSRYSFNITIEDETAMCKKLTIHIGGYEDTPEAVIETVKKFKKGE